MNHAVADTPPHPRRSSWIPWVFVGAFLVVVAANGVLVAIAVSTFNGLATENAYMEGLAYNRTLDQAADQARLGWTVTPSFRPAGDLVGDLTLIASGATGAPLTGATVTVALSRPTQAGHDFVVTLEALEPGHYGAAIAFPLPGVWDARVEVARDGRVWHQVRRIVVR